LGTVITAHQDISGKQDKLVSGTNIKTINGTSLLGSGDIVISGGGGGSSSGSGSYSEVNHGTSDTTFALTPNTFHVWDEVASLTLTLGSETAGVVNEYLFQFTSGSTATTLSLPSDLKWTDELVIEANMIYQVSILKGLVSVLEFSNAPDSVFPVTLDYSNQDIALNLRVFNEIHSVAQGSNITLNSGDLTFVFNGNNISVVDSFYVDYNNAEYDGYVLYDTGMEYYILNASGRIKYYFYD
jgi:hypothetical protein